MNKTKPTDKRSKWKLKKLQAGLCVTCGKPAVNKYYCQYHREKANKSARESMRKLRAKRKQL